jgi:hypothetical protein
MGRDRARASTVVIPDGAQGVQSEHGQRARGKDAAETKPDIALALALGERPPGSMGVSPQKLTSVLRNRLQAGAAKGAGAHPTLLARLVTLELASGHNT